MTDAPRTRRIVVTGAARGIGAAITRRFLTQGDDVLLVDRDDSILAQLLPSLTGTVGTASSCCTDLADRRGIEDVVSAVRGRWGSLDVLVNNAGIDHREPFLRHQAEGWDRVLAINLTAPFLLSQSLGRLMAEQGHGVVVHVASIDSLFADGPSIGYNAAKAGLLGLMRTMAVELAPHGIRCNAVLPGFTATEMVRRDASEERWTELRTKFRRAPLGRMVEPHEIAAAVAFLASDDASAITGASLVVDGGVTANVYVQETLNRD